MELMEALSAIIEFVRVKAAALWASHKIGNCGWHCGAGTGNLGPLQLLLNFFFVRTKYIPCSICLILNVEPPHPIYRGRIVLSILLLFYIIKLSIFCSQILNKNVK
jgi:hypothetical protein